MSEQSKLTDYEIVQGLRSTDPKERQRALDAVYPDSAVVMAELRKDGMQTATTDALDARSAGGLFTAAVLLAQRIATALGVTLAWVGPQSQQPRIEAVTELDKVGAALARRGRGFGS